MTDKFILLTKTDNNPVIIGLSNISSIELPDSENDKTGSVIILNFARNRDLWPRSIEVIESLDQIKTMLGL